MIIPFRDEATHLPNLLASIAALNYPESNVSFWFIDDDSQDDSCTIIEELSKKHAIQNVHLLQNKRQSNSPKKDAIVTAISHLKNNWIVTTDADCMLPENWLHMLNQKIVLEQPKMIAAPVTYVEEMSFFKYYQLLDFLSLQGTTIGSFGIKIPFLCNGANLAYQKDAFLDVDGFSGNDTLASGDDVFLLEKFVQKFPDEVVYLKSKDALVKTYAVSTWKAFISQRVRWASKSANYTLYTGKIIGIIVMLMNLLFCVLPLFLFGVFSWKVIVLIVVSKIVLDSVLLLQTLQFTQQKIKPFFIFISGITYPYLTIFIFIKSLFSSYQWKNRTFKK
ncbi:glycosyltransferase family 2 protein [Kordia periserrulae]|uniref:glycosyltransferase family 2 protein n=1 Tax=Kordia periserrulae TaxID=701523 RepID=UPI001304EF62|nr:glycosyltransferase [Kordia periserrulae]